MDGPIMLDALKTTGKNIGHQISRAWENLSEGWRELLSRSSNALTHFGQHKDEIKVHGKDGAASAGSPANTGSELAGFPRWSLLAGEVEETAKEIVVRVELPGMDKADCSITIEGNLLRLSGEKRALRETHNSTYHVMERAYGAFERTIPLPRNVAIDQARASFKNGVLTVHLPKQEASEPRSLQLS
jgi:HSP20 family protein